MINKGLPLPPPDVVIQSSEDTAAAILIPLSRLGFVPNQGRSWDEMANSSLSVPAFSKGGRFP